MYRGAVPFQRVETDLANLVRPRTKMMVNLGNPNVAFRTAGIPNDGVGLARLEFIITEYVKAHPMALAHPERIRDPSVRESVMRLARDHATPSEFFVARLSEGVGTIAAAFYPKPVIVRLSDFKTNEYAKLLGGADFEPAEPNPMIGFRGASRYAHPAYEDGFALECAALKRVRESMGLTNVKLMIPFCRRVEEAKNVLACMAKHGLQRGRNGLEVYVMCEIPNNVISIDAFAEHFDGFSIGSNDLTQLTLGVDRDSETVAFDFDERDPGVLKMLELAVEGARRNGRHSGICGQAPSDFPEVAEFLVRLGIDSLSLNPDSLLSTTLRIIDLEASIAAGGAVVVAPAARCSVGAERDLFQLAMIQQAGLLPRELSVAEQREVGNAAHVVALRERAVRFGVDLQHDGAPGEIGRGLRHLRRGRLARPAPRCPEIHEHGYRGCARDLVELGGVDVERFAERRQLAFARAAAAAIREVPGRHAILRCAVWTGTDHVGFSSVACKGHEHRIMAALLRNTRWLVE